eukprot:SAG25_NODE_1162_length_3720_cov_739.361502_5_plen_154_part_00
MKKQQQSTHAAGCRARRLLVRLPVDVRPEQRPPSRGSVSVNYTRMHAYRFAVRARERAAAAAAARAATPTQSAGSQRRSRNASHTLSATDLHALHTDSGHNTYDDSRAHGGHAVYLVGGPVAHSSKKLAIVTDSTLYSEYVQLHACGREVETI